MIKNIILLFNLMGVFLYQLFFQANVNVTQNVPASANAGTSFNIEVTINKADVSGFAKYEEDFPAGFTAEAVEKQGATVLSSGNAIKFIWASLPSDATVKISIKVTADASVSGAQTLKGKFLYVVNNERQESDPADASITIGGNSQPVAVTQTQPAAVTQTEPAAVTQTQPAAVTQTEPAAVTQTQPTATNTVTPTETNTVTPVATNTVAPTPAAPSINITRSYSSSSVAPAGDETVTITIHKGNLSGFAKLEETIPNGLVIAEGEKQGASFTYADGKAKFVWLNLPADSVFTVTYKATAASNASGDQSIAGEFSYLIDNNAKTYTVAATSFSVQATSQPVAVTQTEPAAVTQTQPAAVTQTEPAAVTQTEPAAVTQTQPAVVTQTEPAAITQTQPATTQTNDVTPNIPAASGSVNYRVQIMALHNPVKASFLVKRFSISETIKQEMLEGYTKYTVGSFSEYKSVRDHREEVKSKGVQGPFVVAYNAGKRITVQEALMITHQQWYQ